MPQPGYKEPALHLTIGDVQARRKQLHKVDPPIWRNYPLMISLAAFALSLCTTFVSIWTARVKDIHDRQSDLTAALQRFQDLSFKDVETSEKFRGTPFETFASDLIHTQMDFAIEKAQGLALDLDTDASYPDLMAAAGHAHLPAEFRSAKPILEIALRASTNELDRTEALVDLGFAEFRLAKNDVDRKSAQERFSNALSLDKSEAPDHGAYLNGWVELEWADAIAPVDCEGAKLHFEKGAKILVKLPMTPVIEMQKRVISDRAGMGFPDAQCRPKEDATLLLRRPQSATR